MINVQKTTCAPIRKGRSIDEQGPISLQYYNQLT